MELPFTSTDFFDVLADYNLALWPAAATLWFVSVVLLAASLGGRGPRQRTLSGLLAVHWVWSALAYHVAFFTTINPAAWLFAALFLVQGALFVWFGVVRGELHFSTSRSVTHGLAGALVVYALLYPVINVLEGLQFPRMPTFGLPCPTTLLTLGLLMTVRHLPWALAVIPIGWAVVGGSAAVLFGVRADLALFVGAGLLLGTMVLNGLHPSPKRVMGR